MIYSVWNQGARAFDYFEAPGSDGVVNAPHPRHLRAREMGATPNQAAWPLPAGAKRVGRGPLAKGRIASTGTSASLGAFDIDSGMLKVGLLLTAAYVLWRKTR